MLKQRMRKDDKSYSIIIVDNLIEGDKMICLTTTYHTIQEAMHKIECDLMTNLYNGFTEPIEICIVENGR